MLSTGKIHVYTSTLILILTISLYLSLYRGLLPSTERALFAQSSGAEASELPNLALELHPQDHIHRDPRKHHYTWNITSGLRAPDGVVKELYLINGNFPGPLIEVRPGDEIQVEVHNNLHNGEGIAIHWHGLSMRGANEMDGVVGLTQCAIEPSNSFTYKFKLDSDQVGTFWYHAHSELRVDGLYGAFVIHEPVHSDIFDQEYEKDMLLLIGDWYHRPASKILDYYTDWTNFGVEPAPDSILINGHGSFNCSMAVPARPVECKHVVIPLLRFDKPYTRLRVINTGALTGFTLSLSGLRMKLFRIDGGHPISGAPVTDSLGVLYPGERMDVIVEWCGLERAPPLLKIQLDRENLKFKNFALNATQYFPIAFVPDSVDFCTNGKPTGVLFNLGDASGVPVSIPTSSEETFLLYTKIEILSEYSNIPKGFINRTFWETPSEAFPLREMGRGDWGSSWIPWTGPGNSKWIDIVVNNMDDKSHPFHLHGHSFYVVASHKGKPGSYDAYNPFGASEPPGGPLNTLNPLRKDTISVPRKGYVVLRLEADNEGLWLFHCHIIWHHAVGMAMAFQVGGDEHGLAQYEAAVAKKRKLFLKA